MNHAVYSIRKRLLVALGAAISIATLVQASISYRVALHEVDDISDYHMIQMAHSMRHRVPDHVNTTSAVGERQDPSFRLQITPLPSLLADSVSYSPSQLSEPSVAGVAQGFSTRQIGKKTYRVFTAASPTMLIEVMHDMDVRSGMAGKLASRTVLPILVLGPLLLLIVWWSTSYALRPLITSREEIARRDANDLRALRTEGVPKELLPFIQEINVLFIRVGHAFAAQQNFVADAAHELRSPLTALRLQVQALHRTTTSEMRQFTAERLLTGIDRATRLVEQMLVLAREESAVIDVTSTDLPHVVRLALSDVLPQAQLRNIDVGADIPVDIADDQFRIRGSTETMRILIRNLLENAVKYTPIYGTVNLSLQHDAKNVTLHIEDSGPGIPVDERSTVFERFHRGSSHNVEGSGLGLSIVQAIASRHEIEISLDRSPRFGGLSVCLVFKNDMAAPTENLHGGPLTSAVCRH